MCRLPHPSECQLYYVNRDTLFSYHKASEIFLQVSYVSFVLRALFKNLRVILEAFDGMDLTCLPGLLQRMMALYVASHYKNSPNDLQLMSNAPKHHLFVLLGKC